MKAKIKNSGLKKRRRWLLVLILFLIGIIYGLYKLDNWVKKYNYDGAGDFISTVSSNYFESWNANYQIAEMTIAESDFQKLQSQRDYHLKRGIITKVEDRYVPAIITFKGNKIRCRARLKGHMTDHLQENKWSFRIKTVKGDSFDGMRIFSLMHPGTRNYIYEWIYHQLLISEKIATIRYNFIKLKVNGKSWGIYAVEENFASELLQNNSLPQGPILGWNADQYWKARINHHDKIDINYDDTEIFSSYAEGFEEDEILKDKKLRKSYATAISLLEKFKRGELKTSAVFDIEKLAKFHAIVDLVGGHFSLDWSDVKYYYNPFTNKIEPIGYESFSVQNTNYLSGANNYKANVSKTDKWHTLLFSDIDFFNCYVKHLKRLSNKKYLENFFRSIDEPLKNNLAILYVDFPYKKLDLKQYYINQKNIRTLLHQPITPVIYLVNADKHEFNFVIGNNSSLPLIISKIRVNDSTIKLVNKKYISSIPKNNHVLFENLKIENTFVKLKKSSKVELIINYPDSKKEFVLPVKRLEISILDTAITYVTNINDFDDLNVNIVDSIILLKKGSYIFKKNLIIPKGFKFIVEEGVILNLLNQSEIVSYSPVQFNGSEDFPIRIQSSDSSGKGIKILNSSGINQFSYVDFVSLNNKKKNENASLIIYNSIFQINQLSFNNSKGKGIALLNSKGSLNSVFFAHVRFALDGQFSNFQIRRFHSSNIKNTSIDLNSCSVNIQNTNLSSGENGVVVDNGSFVSISKISLIKLHNGIIVKDNSITQLNNIELNDVVNGISTKVTDDKYFFALVKINKIKSKEVDLLISEGKNTKIEKKK